MFAKHDNAGYTTPLEKIRMKTLVHGDKTLMTEFLLEEGALLPRHGHPHEQTGYLVSGSMELTIGDETHRLSAGDSWCIPGGVEHSAIARERSVAIEVFSPVREDYLRK
ncbi:MAG: cupin domain-containing protein [Nitrospirota bacterium]